MILNEIISIEGDPFPSPLPIPGPEFVAFLSLHGFTFEDEDGTLRLRQIYEPTRLEHLQRLLNEHCIKVEVTRSVRPLFDDTDFNRAPLWAVLFPDVFISEVEHFRIDCRNCGKRRIRVDRDVQVEVVKSKKPFLSVNGDFDIVRTDIGKQMEETFSGTLLSPFDKHGRYQYLLSKSHLRHLLIRLTEVSRFDGECSECSSPLFGNHFGPFRYPREEWNGDDIVYSDCLETLCYAPRVFEFMRRHEKRIRKHGIVLFEQPEEVLLFKRCALVLDRRTASEN